ncbi:MAG: pilus assembly protein [Rhizobiaceae bacterium]|nr:pilus assembly protein [Rhizobiaceae bacterium]
MLKKFGSDERGVFAIMVAVVLIPVLLAIGFAVDLGRYMKAESYLQELADSASLALAAAREKDKTKLTTMANEFVGANDTVPFVDDIHVSSLVTNDNLIDLGLNAQLKTYFMGLANIHTMNVNANAEAIRAVSGSVEVALVLDNTYSMIDSDGAGSTKIATLRTAATGLVTELFKNKDADVRIAVVPYADYVNVGTGNRNQPWVSVPADYTTVPAEKVCTTKTTKSVCVKTNPTYACTKDVDGVIVPTTCGGGCAEYQDQTVAPYQSCTGGGSGTSYTWYGCVGSRTTGELRLSDLVPATPYPGYLNVKDKPACPTAITPLSKDQATVTKAVSEMNAEFKKGSYVYQPLTYIPSGLIWGLNVLSSTAPFTEGLSYDKTNIKPRKVVVLMTDGENTLRLNTADGKHLVPSGTAANKLKQMQQTDTDTRAICKTIKDNKIELFTIAFNLDSEDAKSLLSSCATDADHFYDAKDSAALMAAFSGIAQSLTQVRLAR